MNTTETLVQQTLREVFQDKSIVYDKSRFAGGLTNYNYIMDIHGASYVIREPGLMTEHMLNRPSEHANNIIASELGINSVCTYFDEKTGIKISEYVPHCQNFAALDPSSSRCLQSVAALLKTTHASPKPFENVFDWEAELCKYEQIAQGLNGQLFSDYPFLKQTLLSLIAHNVPHLESVPCHNDTVPENFLCNVRAHRPYLIDWEYSGMNDPTWDIAMYIAESRLSGHAISEFFSYYFGSRGASREELLKIRCFILAQDLLWSMWAVVRHYSGEDFIDYCYNHYNRFRRNLKAVSKDTSYPISEMVKW